MCFYVQPSTIYYFLSFVISFLDDTIFSLILHSSFDFYILFYFVGRWFVVIKLKATMSKDSLVLVPIDAKLEHSSRTSLLEVHDYMSNQEGGIMVHSRGRP